MAEENKAEQKTPAVGDARDKLESSKQHARKAAEDLKSAAGSIATSTAARQSRNGEKHAAKQNKLGGMREIAPAHFRKTRSNMCAKIQRRRFLPRSESGLFWG